MTVGIQARSVSGFFEGFSVSPSMSGLFKAGFLRAQPFIPLVVMPGLLLLFPLNCACGGHACGGRLVREGKLVSLLEVGSSVTEIATTRGRYGQGGSCS